ncbi:CDP-glycerol glycerophosphotransferase family protein [Streptomyces sp. M19]
MITDYSSLMFDYVNTGRPILFFTYDLGHYRDTLRGFCFDFEENAPGPLVSTSRELVDTIADIDRVQELYARATAGSSASSATWTTATPRPGSPTGSWSPAATCGRGGPCPGRRHRRDAPVGAPHDAAQPEPEHAHRLSGASRTASRRTSPPTVGPDTSWPDAAPPPAPPAAGRGANGRDERVYEEVIV